MFMNKKKVVIDSLGNNEFVMLHSKQNKESVISAKVAYQHYLDCSSEVLPIQFTKKALDEIQNTIEDELIRKEKSSAASYASTNAKVFR